MVLLPLTAEERADIQAELETLRADYERLSFPPMRPVGNPDSRLEQRAVVERGIARYERLLEEKVTL